MKYQAQPTDSLSMCSNCFLVAGRCGLHVQFDPHQSLYDTEPLFLSVNEDFSCCVEIRCIDTTNRH